MPLYRSRKTNQAPDRFLFRGKTWSMIDPFYGPFSPKDHGVTVRPTSTANWRGFITTYRLAGNRLEVADVKVGLSQADATRASIGLGPRLLGKPVTRIQSSPHETEWVYQNLNLPVGFTGVFVIGSDYQRDPFSLEPDASGFRIIYELRFDRGRLQGTRRYPVCVAVDGVPSRYPVLLNNMRLAAGMVRTGSGNVEPKELPELKAAPMPEVPPSLLGGLVKKEANVRLAIDRQGVSRASLASSTGNAAVDQRIRSAFDKWRWTPAISIRSRKPAPITLVIRCFLD